MPIHADVVLATNPKPDADATPAAPGELTEDPAPTDGAADGARRVSSTTTPRSGKKEKKQ